MAQVVLESVAVTTTGIAGSATGNANTPSMVGTLLDIYVDYNASVPATTDLVITYTGYHSTAILTLTDRTTDGYFVPRRQACDNVGALIAGAYDEIVLDGPVKVTINQCDALAPAATVYFRYLRQE